MNQIYENDILRREKYVKKLKQFIENQITLGRTILLNGRYGEGKTTIINYLQKEFKQNDGNINCLYYNVWENNFYEEPLIPFLCALEKLKSKSKKIMNASKKLISNLPKIFINALTSSHGIDCSSILENQSITTNYSEFKNALTDYKKVIETTCKNKKLLILVDELDRCLPSYQIMFLERLHHVFSNIPNLFVLIAVDQNQLEHAIVKTFGNSTNVEGYLYKFFDFLCDIPTYTKYEYYVNELTDSSGSSILEAMNLSIRESMKILSEHKILMDYYREFKETNWVSDFFMFILFVKHKDKESYYLHFSELEINAQNNNFALFKQNCNEQVQNLLHKIYKEDKLLYTCICTYLGCSFESIRLTTEEKMKIRPYFHFDIYSDSKIKTIKTSCQNIEYEKIHQAIQLLL